MQFQMFNSKLFIPRTDGAIQRSRLFPVLDEILKKKITTVTAAAGYGKTTIISQAIDHLNAKAVWYQLDNYDNDLLSFLGYFIKGFNKYSPNIKQKMQPLMEQEPTSQREITKLLSTLLIELENTTDDDILIILDDYHFIINNEAINHAILYLLDRFPPNIHLILISRVDPEQFGKLNVSIFRSRQQHLEINESDIAFSLEEINQVLNSIFHIKLSEQKLNFIYKQTGGWIAGLMLSSPQKRKIEIQNKNLFGTNKSTHNIFRYFEINILSQLSENIVDFLLKSSYFSELEAELCNQLLGIKNSNKILSLLVNQRIFTIPFYEEKYFYRYHNLFQEFLQQKFQQKFTLKERKRFHNQIAVQLEKLGKQEDALRHYLKADQSSQIIRLLKEIGYKLLLQGHLEKINSYIKNLPKDIKDNNPDIIFLKSKIESQKGNTYKEIAGYKKALELFKLSKDEDGELNCLNMLGFHYTASGDFVNAKKILNKLLPRLQTQPQIKIEALGHLSLISSYLGDFNSSDKYIDESSQVVATLQDEDKQYGAAYLYMFKVLKHLWRGDFIKALDLSLTLKDLCIDLNLSETLSFSYHLLSRANYFLGEYQTGYEMAMLGILEADKVGLKDIYHVWPMHGAAHNLLGLNKVQESIDLGQMALQLFQSLDYVYGKACAYQQLHYAHIQNNDSKSALQSLESGLDVMKKVTMPLMEGGLKADWATMLIKEFKFDEAKALLKQVQKALLPSKYGTAHILRLLAFCEWSKKNKVKSKSYLNKAIKICMENNYNAWLKKEASWITPMIFEFQNDRNIGNNQKTFLKNVIKIYELVEEKVSNSSKVQNDANNALPSPLSKREIEVLQMMARGLTNVEISEALNISSHTAKSHVTHIFNKLGVNDRAQASVWAVQNNLY